jgi:hypothetical protein
MVTPHSLMDFLCKFSVNRITIAHKICTKKMQNGQVNIQVDGKIA